MPVISGSDVRSGFTNISPRIQIRDKDNKSGAYPTIVRIGDPDFSGASSVRFDDTNTVIFNESVEVSYPTLLRPSGKYLEFLTSSVSSPNTISGITAIATVRKGIADNFVSVQSAEENLGPFKEHLSVFPNNGSFFMTGTDPDILPGFSTKLGSKTIIKIPLTVLAQSSIFWSTGTLPNALGTAGGVNSGISYFNFEDGVWEPVGVDLNTTTGSAVDYLHPDIQVRSASLLATAGGDTSSMFLAFPGSYLEDFQALSGFPCSTFGFPSAQKFEAKSSQKLKLSNFIKKPFLIEKFIFNWTGSLDLLSFNPSNSVLTAPHRATFGILNNFKNNNIQKINTKFTNSTLISAAPTIRGITFNSAEYSGSNQKDIIASARLQGIFFPSTISDLSDKQKCEFSFQKSSNGPGGGITGSFSVEAVAKVPGVILSSSMIYSLSDTRRTTTAPRDEFQFLEWSGGRTGLGLDVYSSNRSVIKPFVGEKIVSQSITGGTAVAGAILNTNDPLLNQFDSPYMLFPSDELIFYATNQPKDGSLANLENFYADQLKWTMAPGEHYVLLIGSEVLDGKEVHDTNNQPLTSVALHEAILSDGMIVDQWQVEALTCYSGSYIDDVFSGSFLQGTRGVFGSTAAGTQGTTGSLMRGVKLVNQQERFYDTLLPTVFDFHRIDGFTSIPDPTALTSGKVIGILNPFYFDSIFTGSDFANNKWIASYPFESKYSTLKRNISFDPLVDTTTGERIYGIYMTASGTNETSPSSVSAGFLSSSINFGIATADEVLKFWFGTGDGYANGGVGLPNVPNLNRNAETLNSPYRISSLRGFKYGIKNAIAENSSVVFRNDRYGNFRDLLEQRQDSSFVFSDSVFESPVKVIFVDPSTGRKMSYQPVSSSNKSNVSTSSLPYFDGIARN